jgi:acyl transferase domain-containing protein
MPLTTYYRLSVAGMLGIVAASAVNTNGRASSLTAPNGPAQQALIRETLTSAGLRPAEVDGLQMHSNGTALGDPIEVGAVAAVMLVSDCPCLVMSEGGCP